MSFDFDEDILQDFLVEAGEILEALYEQLVELENNVSDVNLLNAIFRGFHTIKGGAGFLQLTPLVELCHIAENAFDELRKGNIIISPQLMDVVLQATDSIKSMFNAVTKRQFPEAADPQLLKKLHALVIPHEQKSETPLETESITTEIKPVDVAAAAQQTVEPSEHRQIQAADLDMFSEDELTSSPSADTITEVEFEAILDQLHGQTCSRTAEKPENTSSATIEINPENNSKLEAFINNKNAEISDDEFESLLDVLQGPAKKSQQSVDNASDKTVAMNSVVSEKFFTELKSTAQKIAADHLPQVASSDKIPPVSVATKVQPALQKNTVTAKPVTQNTDNSNSKEAPETTVRVDTKRLDDIMNMVGELVLVRNRLVRLGLKSVDEAMAKAVANLDVVTADLQMSVMKTRMQPIKKVFGRFPRVVRDLARSLNKEVLLELKGEETDLDKNLVEALSDPLVHLVRNSVDHGIESPERRVAVGKSRAGTVVLSAQQEGDHIMLTITDDGAGMDPQLLKRKAVEKGLMDQDAADRLSESETFNLIFHPGFSTKDQISDVSGRGVGMDVVKTKITQLNGSIQVQSEVGKGSVIAIKVPLTLAIMPTLMVMLANQTFALPLVSVNEIFHLNMNDTNEVDGQEVVIVREKALPLFRLRNWLIKPDVNKTQLSSHVVIVSVGTRKVGFLVDQLIGQEEVVIKPLGRMLNGTPGMAGATITGDGSIALILDVPSLLKQYASTPNKKPELMELLQAS
jgi:two-component system chemotaxis sensor kinase CheA